MFEMNFKEKIKIADEVTPNRVLELTMEFSDKGYKLIEARRRAWHKYTYENSELPALNEKPKAMPLHRL